MLEIIDADLNNPEHGAAFVELLNAYALDPMGGGEALPAQVKSRLVEEVRQRPTIRVILALQDGQPAGFCTCIEGFSTFAAQPLLNIHDIAVAPGFRGMGIAKRLLARVEEIAIKTGCCKITLEVLEGNRRARALYASSGYADYALDPAMGSAQLMQKKLM